MFFEHFITKFRLHTRKKNLVFGVKTTETDHGQIRKKMQKMLYLLTDENAALRAFLEVALSFDVAE